MGTTFLCPVYKQLPNPGSDVWGSRSVRGLWPNSHEVLGDTSRILSMFLWTHINTHSGRTAPQRMASPLWFNLTSPIWSVKTPVSVCSLWPAHHLGCHCEVCRWHRSGQIHHQQWRGLVQREQALHRCGRNNISSQVRKAHKHLDFLRRLSHAGLGSSVLSSFYGCVPESVLCSSSLCGSESRTTDWGAAICKYFFFWICSLYSVSLY